MKRRLLIVFFTLLIMSGLVSGWLLYSWVYFPNTPAYFEKSSLKVLPGMSVDDVVARLDSNGQIIKARSLRWTAKRMSFDDEDVKPGIYTIETAMTNRELVHKLRLGQQTPVDLIVRPQLTVNRMVSDLASQLMTDSSSLAAAVEEHMRTSDRWNETNLPALFIPNTYEVYWSTSPARLLERLEREHDRYWNSERLAAARRIGLSQIEIHTLASIVERETYIDAERPVIAGVYLNRLRLNMALQADPTILFANGDFGIRRVLYKHLEVDSPYNTYKYSGLPPGPICIPSRASIEAVLQSDEHKYLYFCAKPGATGHVFAENLTQHNRNAQAYRRWIASQR